MNYGDSVVLNEQLLATLEMCNGKIRAIREIDASGDSSTLLPVVN